MIFYKLRQYRTEKILKNIFFCCRTASLGGKGLTAPVFVRVPISANSKLRLGFLPPLFIWSQFCALIITFTLFKYTPKKKKKYAGFSEIFEGRSSIRTNLQLNGKTLARFLARERFCFIRKWDVTITPYEQEMPLFNPFKALFSDYIHG